MSSHSSKVVTRFAPSPTGYMHVGGVRTALFAWAFAKKHKEQGTFILRFEDTDRERLVAGSSDHIIESLRWLGTTWDEGPDIGGPHAPYVQSERLDSYRKYAQMLIEKGLAYADPYTQEELEAFRKKAEAEKRPFLYRDHRPENPPAWIDEDSSRKPLRLKITKIETTKWHDEVRGDLSAGAEALDDFILIKSDGYPTYNFAHIIDDIEMEVTHIFRADEFISSTPKYLALYDALESAGVEFKRPEFGTLPPIIAADGKKKLGKRDGAKDILTYRAEGYLPEAMINFLAFIGWNPGDNREIFTPQEFIEAFDLSHVQSAGAKLNEDKLIWTNKEHLHRMTDEEFKKRLQEYMQDFCDARTIEHFESLDFEKVKDLIRNRMSVFGEIKDMLHGGELAFVEEAPVIADKIDLLITPEKMRKNGAGQKVDVTKESAKVILNQVMEILAKYEGEWTTDAIKESVWAFAEHEGRGVVLWPMRVALSGREKSADPFSMAYILGKEETLKRLEAAVSAL